MERILTLTMNPTIDQNTRLQQVVPERKLRCAAPIREPGGGGINVSRAISRLGGTSKTLYLAGGLTGDILQRLLEEEELDLQRLPVEGWTRENLIIYEESSGQQFRFGMPGPQVSAEECEAVLDALRRVDPAPTYLVASGSLPPGVPSDFYGRVADISAEMGARLIVDTSGAALRHAAEIGAFLLKPNLSELQDLAGRELSGEGDQLEAARELVAEGKSAVVVVSLGAAGALLMTKDGHDYIRTPIVPIRSKVGAGDSMVGAITLGLSRGMSIGEAVRLGVAAGASAVMSEGTELCRKDDVERLYADIMAG